MEGFDKQTTLAYLEQASKDWQRARESAQRAGGTNRDLNSLERERMGRVDGLLDELIILGGVGRLSPHSK